MPDKAKKRHDISKNQSGGFGKDPYSELEFLKSLWGLETEDKEGYRTGPPGYIGWRNSFLGIDSGAPYTCKNTGSDMDPNPGEMRRTLPCQQSWTKVVYIQKSKRI